MSYPLSASGYRKCSLFYLSGSETRPNRGCKVYPCIHTETHDLDWLADREDNLARPQLREFSWRCYYNPELLVSQEAAAFEAQERAQMPLIMARCGRLMNKQGIICADILFHHTMMWEERDKYFKYWESLTEAQLTEFRKDPHFIRKERLFRRLQEARG
jgi:hypothetical protein